MHLLFFALKGEPSYHKFLFEKASEIIFKNKHSLNLIVLCAIKKRKLIRNPYNNLLFTVGRYLHSLEE